MNTAGILLEDFDVEVSNTRRTLERLPPDKPNWIPHPRSMPLGKLAMHCVTLPLFGSYIIEDDGMDVADQNRPHVPLVFVSPADCVLQFEHNAARCRELIASAPDDRLAANWRFTYRNDVILEGSRVRCFRQLCFNHLVHHTSQLGVYLRLNGIHVPALYGPSADENWVPET